jgi:PKHD-type hydroxylase
MEHAMHYRSSIFPTLQRIRRYHLDFRGVLGVLTAEECQAVIAMADAEGAFIRSELFQPGDPRHVRDSDLAWIEPHPGNEWLFDRVANVVNNLNRDYFEFDLDGSMRAFQLTRYKPNQHYSWHEDLGSHELSRRKITVSMQLSPPEDYDGGVLEFFHAEDKVVPASTHQGSLVAFPSFATHRVTPITRGHRWSIVTWLEGPPFR